MALDVLADGATVVGNARFDPLDAMDLGALARERREDPGPRRDARVLVRRAQEGEAVAPRRQHCGHRPRRPVEHDADVVTTRAVRGGDRGDLHPVEDAPPARRPESIGHPRPLTDHQVRLGRLVADRKVAVPRCPRRLAPATARARPQPVRNQRKPLLTGPSADRPERDGHTRRCAHHRESDSARRRPRPEREHPDHQTEGDRGDLSSSPAGDDPAALERWEAVVDPLAALSHRQDRPQSHRRAGATARRASRRADRGRGNRR